MISIPIISTTPAARFSSRRRACSRLQAAPNVSAAEDGSNTIYVTDDTVWYDGVAEVARRFANVVLLFAGSAQTRGPFHLTMDTNDAIETAQAFPNAVIVPVHYEGWAHFKQSGDDLLKAFNTLGFGSRLQLLEPGVATIIESGTKRPKS